MESDLSINNILKKILYINFRLIYRVAIFFAFIFFFIFLARQLIERNATIYPFLGIWLLLSYVTLPMLHRKLTKIYLPNYYIGRTRTVDGILGDPVNLAFYGSKSQIINSMQKSGWVIADDLNTKSTMMMIVRTLLRKPYATAPVSSLFLFGNKQDFALQKEDGRTTSKRHHVRFWKTPKDWFLPGGFKADYLAAATYDRRVGLSIFTLQITHKIDANIDEERDYIISDLKTKNKNIPIKYVKNFSSAYHARNGGGDFMHTDGTMPFINLK